jgi:uncharacterized protein YuzE
MRWIIDYADRTVRLTDERLGHIHEHPEMVGQERRIREVLQELDVVFTSHKDSSVHLSPLCARPGWVKASNGSRQDSRRRRVCDYGFLYGRSEGRGANMAKRVARLRVWFDEEGDFLEVTFAKRKGSFRSIGPDIFERVDAKGKVIGFAIFNFLKHDRKTVEIPLEEAKLAIGR